MKLPQTPQEFTWWRLEFAMPDSHCRTLLGCANHGHLEFTAHEVSRWCDWVMSTYPEYVKYEQSDSNRMLIRIAGIPIRYIHRSRKCRHAPFVEWSS